MVGQGLDLVNENNEKVENLKLAYLAIDEDDNVTLF